MATVVRACRTRGITMSWAEYLDSHQSRFVDELLEFIRIPSVSAKPENTGDVRVAGQWVVDRLRAAGIDNAEMLETAGPLLLSRKNNGNG